MFKRLANLVRGFFGLFLSDLEKSNPGALLEVEKENLRKNIARYNDNMTGQAAIADRLKRQIQTLEKRERELEDMVRSRLETGDRDQAGQWALELKTLREQLEENRTQLRETERNYRQLLDSRKALFNDARTKIENLKRLISDTEMLKAQADLKAMAAGMSSETGGSGDSVNRLEEQLLQMQSEAAGRIRTADNIMEKHIMTGDRKERAERALREFEAGLEREMESDGEPESERRAEPRRELGPEES